MDLLELKAKNFCCFGEFSLPLSHQGLVWVSGSNQDTQAADNNGCGKSSIFKALTWCIWGETIDGEKGDKVIRKGEKIATVELAMRDNDGGQWTIVRDRAKGAPALKLIQPDGNFFSAGKISVQDRISEMIGLDFQAFKNTVLYGQNDSARFAHPRTKDAERKEMLHRILRTGILNHCHQIALSKRQQSKGDIQRLELEAQHVNQSLSFKEDSLISSERIRDGFEAQRKIDVERLELEVNSHKEAAAKHLKQAKIAVPDNSDVGVRIAALENSIAKNRKALIEARQAKDECSTVEELIEKIKTNKGKVDREVSGIDFQVKALERSINELSGDKCPVCTSPLSTGDAHTHKAELKTQLVSQETAKKRLMGALEDAQEELTKLEAQRKRFKGVASGEVEALEGISKAERKKSDLEAASSRADAEKDLCVERAQREVDEARRCARACREMKDKPNPYSDPVEKLKTEIKSDQVEAKRIKKTLGELVDEAAYVEFWVRGFSNQGLPSYILDGVMPYISDRANHYLETLSDGDIKLEFHTQREKKSAKGEYRDEISITWEIEGVTDSYPPSGGQLRKMEIAVDLALMDLVATREGNHIDLLVLDEVLDGLDGEGVQRVLLLLKEMRTRRQSIFVISHEADMSDIFERAIFVEKCDQESKVRMVS